VVQTHSLQHDRQWLQALLPQPLAYLGLLGPRGRREEILKQLGLPAEQLYAPVGLDLGAEGPEQLAVSIVSQMLALPPRRPRRPSAAPPARSQGRDPCRRVASPASSSPPAPPAGWGPTSSFSGSAATACCGARRRARSRPGSIR